MATDARCLLLEALMFFSSGEDHDDNVSVADSTSSDFDHDTSVFAHGPYNPHWNEAIVVESSPLLSRGVALPLASRTAQLISPPSKPLLRRKRVKKCTYAARREEVARLRACVMQLEAQLQHLQQRVDRGAAYHERAQYERAQLTRSRAECLRLRAMVSANEARIHKALAAQHWQ